MQIQTAISMYISIATLIGLFVFFRGYFIDRSYILTQSPTISKETQQVIFLVIDSLRSDLAISEHFPFITNMLERNPSQALFFVSIAEVPTVTGPRLQAMTSGNFPPLSKLLDNFHASEIVEDNLMFQLNKANKTSFFTGDDTWMGLYPNQFTVSFPQNSFNIKDTDTVDGFNRKQLLENMNKDYDFVAAHFLGLDHAGHKNDKVFDNPELNQKLGDLNFIMEELYENMKNDSIMIIVGDHGMANDGNHGGNSTEETNTAFFAVRKTGTFTPKYMKQLPDLNFKPHGLIKANDYIRAISQIDIVPTLAKLLGIAIPYSNLGSVIPEIINNDQDCEENLHQVLVFVNDVHKNQGKFTTKQISKWNSQTDLKTCLKILPLLKEIQSVARSIWNEYDIPLLQISFVFQFILLNQFVIFILLLQQPDYDVSKQFEFNLTDILLRFKYFILGMIALNLISIMKINWTYVLAIDCVIISCLVMIFSLIVFRRTKSEQRIRVYSDLLQVSKPLPIQEKTKKEYSYEIWILNAIFCYKIILQILLLLSTHKKRKELKYLRNEIYEISILVLIFNIGHLIFNAYMRNQLQAKLLTIVKKIFYYTSIAVLIYTTMKIQKKYGNEDEHEKQFWYKSIIQFYIPSMILQSLLFIKIKDQVQNERLYQHFMLFLITFYHLIQTMEVTSSLDLAIIIPRIVYLMALIKIRSFNLLYLFMLCLLVSDFNGLAIYAYFFITLLMVYLICEKHLKNKQVLTFVSIVTVLASYTWFIFGNKCTISSVKVDRAYVGLMSFSLIFSPLILTLFLIGPFVGSLLFLQYIKNNVFAKYDEITKQALQRSMKLIYQINFYIQILLTQIHSYQNAGGIVEIQFKYIFDAVTYIIVLLLVQLM